MSYAVLIGCLTLALFATAVARAEEAELSNLAVVAKATTSFVTGHERLEAINDGVDPRDSADHRHGAYGNWPKRDAQWVQYEWDRPIATNKVDVYWWDDARGVRLPRAARVTYWDGARFVPVPNATGLGVSPDRYNAARFDEVKTSRLRLEIDPADGASTGVIEWKVYDSGNSPDFPPTVAAGVDRVVVMPGATHLHGAVQVLRKSGAAATVKWEKESGPGDVRFANAEALETVATFGAPGEYALRLTGGAAGATASDTVRVVVQATAPSGRNLLSINTTRYAVDSTLWNGRVKNLIVNWIPHCVAMNDKLDLAEGGIDNFIQAGHRLSGRPYKRHVGYPFSNAWVLNTVEAMSVALVVDPRGDVEIGAAQDAMRAKLDEWIPIILAAQEPDGYLQTRFTLGTAREPMDATIPHWNARYRGEHEGYVAGYFIEAAIAHHVATGGKDRRLYDAARKLADNWNDNLGPPPKRAWYDGHQEMEQALVRFGRYVDEVEGRGKGRKYVDLAKFLLDNRGNGEEYDQSHVPVTQQYHAVGHAVRAVYSYSAMADVAMETGDVDYWSATMSLWDNLVNRKLYVTGGVGSGETSEGFGGDYSLRNEAYCESCSGSGMLFFQHKLGNATRDATYADLFEATLYNAILGDVDLAGKNFTYTNALDSDEARYPWHVCPCCIGNIPRTLLMLPTWTYARDDRNLFVNLFVGSTVNVGAVGGSEVRVVQKTDYPWSGGASITIDPKSPARFALRVRVPKRDVSELYTAEPPADGITSLSVNGSPVELRIENGYAVVEREWKAGDTVDVVLPMRVQRVRTSGKVPANAGRVALRYGPLVYNFESVDQDLDAMLPADAKLTPQWDPNLLGGVMTIKGSFADGKPFTAIPNYARLNRGGRSVVWMRETPAVSAAP